jgi:WD40 repeat protein/energy-coupling factor transporter ATP-binding protein EcfA2
MSQVTMNPFPGLRSFDYKEHHLFFGREKNITDLLRKLEQNHFVAIVGTSGTGKSSLIRAGLLPSIREGKHGSNNDEWIIASMKPGNTPLENLANALMEKGVFSTGEAEKDKSLHQEISTFINQSSLGLVQAVRKLITENKRLLILVDQFEEIFRFSEEVNDKNNIESNAFVQLIIDSVRQKDIPIYVLLTLRSDFLGDCVRFEGLPEAINDGHYLVPRLTKEQNKSAITGPVDYAQGKISPRLVQRVINDLGDNPDQLPVLQHALMCTWDSWTKTAEPGEPMDLRHYEMIGTMSKALSNHADEAFNELKNESQKKLIESVFKIITVKTGDNRGIRRPTSVQNLLKITGGSFEELSEVLHPFRKSGRTFILPDEDVKISPTTILDISHESLMRGWERLRVWVDEEMESADIYDRLCTGALLYKEGRAALWRDPELQLAIDWKEKNNPNEPWSRQYNSHFVAAIDFLEESRKERSNEINRKKRVRTIVRSAVATFLIVVSILTTWALFQTKKAKENTVLAEQKTEEALNQKQLAEKAKEMALEASKQAMDAKTYAELQANIAGEQKKLAEEQTSKAEQEAVRATTQEQEALKQKQLAEQKSREALNQKQKADSSQMEASRLRLISIGQNLAFKSLQQKEDQQLAALLAYQSYKMVNENRGNLNDPQLYSALLTASQKIDPTFKPIVIRENSDGVAMNSSGNVITAIFDNGELKTYSTTGYQSTKQVSLSGANSGLNTAYLNDNASFAAVGLDNNSVLIYDLKNPSQPQSLSGHEGLVRAVVFSDNGSLIATGARDSSVILWKNYSQVKKVKFTSRIKALAFNNEQTKLFVGSEDGVVSQYNLNSDDKKNFTTNPGARVQAIRCSQSGKIVVVGYSSGTVQVVNGSGQVIRTLNESGSVDYLSLDEKNDLLVVGTTNKTIHIYHLSDLSLKPIEINCNSSINALAVNSDDYIYVNCADKTIRYYPVKTSWFEKIFTSKITRSFSQEEWSMYIGSDVPYVK